MRKIHLHGSLGEKYGSSIALNVDTAGEAIRALCANFPTFESDLRAGEWHVVRGADIDTGLALDETMIAGYRLGSGDLHIAPVIEGSKQQGLIKTILGGVLIGAAFFFSGGALAAPLMSSGILSGMTWGNVALMGVALAASGVSQMLSGEEDKEKKEESYLITGAQSSSDEGAPVPLVYGEVITGGVPISIGIDVRKMKVIT